mmetsp:Transcript_10084/g.12028  ORF Transcript_10084/g.12028 Transcript_10084/m.12028 type:complete len:352 (-) Transcript_10084:580-1635(-)
MLMATRTYIRPPPRVIEYALSLEGGVVDDLYPKSADKTQKRVVFQHGQDPMRLKVLRNIEDVIKGIDYETIRRALQAADTSLLQQLSAALLDDGETYLTTAVNEGDMEKVAILSDFLDVCSSNCAGETPVYKACLRNDWDLVTYLTKQAPKALNAKCLLGFTPLMEAAHSGREDAVDIMLRHGAMTHIADHHSKTAFSWAASEAYDKTLARLIEGSCSQFAGEGLTRHWIAIMDFEEELSRHDSSNRSRGPLPRIWPELRESKVIPSPPGDVMIPFNEFPRLVGALERGVHTLRGNRKAALSKAFQESNVPRGLSCTALFSVIAEYLCPSLAISTLYVPVKLAGSKSSVCL